MPYSSTKELPDAVKKLSKKAQRAFKSAFNSALKQGKSEQQAFKIAWSAAKRADGDKAMSSNIKCPTCPRQFLDEAALNEHAESVHTLSERRSLVGRAVRAAHGKDAYMVDLSDDWLVYDQYDESTREYRLYKQSYSLDSSGNVKISGDAKEVVRKIAYIPAPKVEVASSTLQTLDIALSTSIRGVPPSDAPHEFAQEEPAFDPNICTDCGRHRVHALHTSTADEASDTAAYQEYSQTTVETEGAKAKSQTPHKFKPQPGNTSVCAVCNRAQGDKLHEQSS